MPTTILTLPRELSQQILGQLPFRDKVRLSATCKEYRAYLVPEIFATIRFTSREKSANSALAAVKSLGEHTTCIEFTCKAYSAELPDLRLPPAAKELLAGRHMPNLHTAYLDFWFDFSPWADNRDHSRYFGRPVRGEPDPRAVKFKNWQIKEDETWQALSMNQHIKTLTVNCLNPATRFDFNNDDSRNFLARLESANFCIQRVHNDEMCDNTITFSDYLNFFEAKMDSLLLSHMHNLKRLGIWAPETGWEDGYDSQVRIGVGLLPGTLPVLESLKLVNGVISKELVSFIHDHTHSLTFLDLEECVSSLNSDNASGVSWAEFFDQIYEAGPLLARLIVRDIGMPLVTGEYELEEDDWDFQLIQEARRQLKSQPSLKVFGYSSKVSRHRHIYSGDYADSANQLILGHDQRAYERLMDLVNKNDAGVHDEWGWPQEESEVPVI
ncbi:hypothetical protein PG985_001875 [Apiospora marii]|uniref:F-box domain-containing protein n=1 Tax=Apiospora marii TaxID=335849 RepID=A0ABR1RZZ2_9PEZI